MLIDSIISLENVKAMSENSGFKLTFEYSYKNHTFVVTGLCWIRCNDITKRRRSLTGKIDDNGSPSREYFWLVTDPRSDVLIGFKILLRSQLLYVGGISHVLAVMRKNWIVHNTKSIQVEAPCFLRSTKEKAATLQFLTVMYIVDFLLVQLNVWDVLAVQRKIWDRLMLGPSLDYCWATEESIAFWTKWVSSKGKSSKSSGVFEANEYIQRQMIYYGNRRSSCCSLNRWSSRNIQGFHSGGSKRKKLNRF